MIPPPPNPTPDSKVVRRPVEIDSTGSPSALRSFEDCLAFLAARTDIERLRPVRVAPGTFRLDRMEALVGALGRPDLEFKSIHVAGSKGKGSVCEMTAAALAGCGFAVGLYTSPHLVDIRERIRIGGGAGGQLITPSEFADAVSNVAKALPAIERKYGPATYFEILTAAALVHFAQQAVDFAVIEVGLGGRLDSTNVIHPEVTAVTAIQLEHTELLGDTLAKIASEKAGIFKKDVQALTIPQKPEVLAAFRERAKAVGCPLSVVGEDIEFSQRFESNPELGPHHRVCLFTPRSTFEHIASPLKGDHQAYNCGLALAIVDALRQRGHALPDRGIAEGLAKASAQGRLEIIHQTPRLMIDGAHTPESIQALLRSVSTHYKFDNLIVVFGCSSDKDAVGMLGKLAGGADKIILTRAADSSRAIEPRDLQRKFAEFAANHAGGQAGSQPSKPVQTAPSIKDAINLAAKAAQRGDLILVTGSFLVAGEAKRLFAEKAKG